jgi:hypothetical protein
MEKTKKVTRSVRTAFVFLGVIAVVCGITLLNPIRHILSMLTNEAPFDYTELFWNFVGSIPAPTVLFIGGLCLIRYSNYLSVRLSRNADDKIPYWEFAAYRLAFTFAGILIISWALPRLGQVAVDFAVRNIPLVGPQAGSSLNSLFWLSFQCAFGAYLIIGAPHNIKWQTHRTNQTAEKESST